MRTGISRVVVLQARQHHSGLGFDLVAPQVGKHVQGLDLLGSFRKGVPGRLFQGRGERRVSNDQDAWHTTLIIGVSVRKGEAFNERAQPRVVN